MAYNKKKEPTAKVYAKIYATGGLNGGINKRQNFDPPLVMTLKEMQEFVGGYIQECACIEPKRILIVNEDGLYMPKLRDNPIATKLVAPHILIQGYIKGPALLIGSRR